MSLFTKQEDERKKRAAVEMANAYREMQMSVAWKDLNDLFEKIVTESNREVDQIPIESLEVSIVAKARGLREAIDRIRKHIGYRTSEGPK